MEDSILISTKKILGIHEDDTSFDPDIIIHINSVFMILHQLGLGPATGFHISDEGAVWDDYLSNGSNLEAVKSYLPLKVRQAFDPPTSSAALESLNNLVKELEWRLNVAAETK